MSVVGLYLRISSDRDATHVGVDRQRTDCRAIAAARWPDATIVEYVDNDVSAYTGQRRPAYERMRAALRDRALVAVVAWNLDRLLRQPRDLEHLIDLGIPIVTASGDLDLTTHDGQLHARILAAVAKKSSDDTSRRVKRAHRDRADQGLWHGGPVPYGYRGLGGGRLDVDPVAAADVQQAAALVVSGMPVGTMVRKRGADMPGPRTAIGWQTLLLSMVVRGRLSDGRPGTWPAILDPFTAARLTATITPHSTQKPRRRWPLTGVARCGRCGGAVAGVTIRNPGKVQEQYRCRDHSCVAFSAQHLHAFVLAALDQRVITATVDDEPTRDTRREQALEHLAEQYALGLIGRGEWEAARRALEGQAASKHLGRQHASRRVDVHGMEGFEPRLSLAVDHILIDPAKDGDGRFRRLDYGRIHIVWRV